MIFDPEWFIIGKNVLAIIGAAGALGFAAYAIRVKAKAVGATAVREEWKELAEVREEKIEHLEGDITKLRDRVSKLEGQYEALLDLRVAQIAERVVEGLRADRLATQEALLVAEAQTRIKSIDEAVNTRIPGSATISDEVHDLHGDRQ